MNKLIFSLKQYKKHALLFIAILLVERAVTILAGLLLVSSNKNADAVGFTPSHFHSPEFSTTPGGFLDGITSNFGTAALLIAIICLALYFYFFLKLLKITEVSFLSEPVNRNTSGSILMKLKYGNNVLLILAVVILLAFIFKTVETKPLENDISNLGKPGLAISFYANFNKALIAKSLLHENEFRDSMFNAFKRDYNEYLDFANTGYWAYYSSDGITRKTKRDVHAVENLYKLFTKGKLREEVVYGSFKLAENVRHTSKAKKMIFNLYENNPKNKTYEAKFREYSMQQ